MAIPSTLSDSPLDSVNVWLFGKISSNVSLDENDGCTMTIIKLAANTAALPIFVVAAIVETVVRSSIFMLVKTLHFFTFAGSDLAKSADRYLIPLKNHVQINAMAASTYVLLFFGMIAPMRINGFQLNEAQK